MYTILFRKIKKHTLIHYVHEDTVSKILLSSFQILNDNKDFHTELNKYN